MGVGGRMFMRQVFQLFQVLRSHPMIGEIGSISGEQPSQGAETRPRAADVDRGPSAGVGPEAVFGSDERYKINGQAHRQPYARIAKTWGGGSVCTAFKVYNHHTAMTAAHCVHDGPGGGRRTRHQIQFASGSNRSGGLGLAKNPLPSGCYGRAVPGGWVSTRERQYDYAVLYLHGRGGAWYNSKEIMIQVDVCIPYHSRAKTAVLGSKDLVVWKPGLCF